MGNRSTCQTGCRWMLTRKAACLIVDLHYWEQQNRTPPRLTLSHHRESSQPTFITGPTVPTTARLRHGIESGLIARLSTGIRRNRSTEFTYSLAYHLPQFYSVIIYLCLLDHGSLRETDAFRDPSVSPLSRVLPRDLPCWPLGRLRHCLERLAVRVASVGRSPDVCRTDLLTVCHLLKPQTGLRRGWVGPMGAG